MGINNIQQNQCAIRVRYRSRVPSPTLLSYVAANLERSVPELEREPGRPEILIVAAGGPSLAGTLSDIQVAQAQGARILAVNEVPHLLVRHGIRPWGAIYVGPVDLTLRSIGTPIAGVRYFIGSTCPPDVLVRLQGHDAVLWHPEVDGMIDAMRSVGVCPRTGFIGGGRTVALHGLSVGAILGFHTIHLHGGDSSFQSSGRVHAYSSVSDAEGYDELAVHAGEQPFATTPELLGQALAFPALRARLAGEGIEVVVHGKGLLPFREARRRANGTEPPIMVAADCGLPLAADGVAEVEAQMF